MFYFRSRHGLACQWPPRQACRGLRFWYTGWPFVPRTSQKWPPSHARSPRSRRPASRMLCACHGLISRPLTPLLPPPRIRFPARPCSNEVPRRVTTKVRSLVGPASRVASSAGNSGSSIRIPVFSLSIEMTVRRTNSPSIMIVRCFKCWRPRIATSPMLVRDRPQRLRVPVSLTLVRLRLLRVVELDAAHLRRGKRVLTARAGCRGRIAARARTGS
jgi:hypothetical protein